MSDPPTAAEIERVVRTYLHGGRLTAMPRSGRKRQILLEQLAQRFEPGRRYREEQVNAVLGEVWDDVAALRRYLVEEGFLDRDGGVYWRTGGSVPDV